MDFLVYGAILFASVGSVYLGYRYDRRQAARSGQWLDARDRTGLSVLQAEVGHVVVPVGLSGRVEGISFDVQQRGDGEMQFTAELRDRAARNLVLQRVSEAPAKSGIILGDPQFDQRILVGGDELRALAVLSVDTRKKAVRLIHDFGMELNAGVLTHVETPAEVDAARVSSIVQLMTSFARAISLDDRDIPRRLFANAGVEPAPALRNRMLQMLFEYAPTSTEAQAGLRMLDEVAVDPIVRIAGNLALGTDGAHRLLQVMEDSPSETHRAYAARLLVRAYRGELIERMLGLVLEDPASEVRRGAVLGLGEAGPDRYTGGLDRLGARLIDEGGDERALVWTIERVQSAGSAPLLLRLLSSEMAEVRRNAARLLGKWGGKEAVMPLKELGQKNLFFDRELRKVIDKALLQIRERLGDAAEGGLTVLDPEEQQGQLSLEAEEGDGALSYAIESGQLEFPSPKPGE